MAVASPGHSVSPNVSHSNNYQNFTVMAKIQQAEIFAVAATLRSSSRGTQYLMVECSYKETAHGGQSRILGNWGAQSEFFESVLAQMPKTNGEIPVDKRLRLNDVVSLGDGVIYVDNNVPKLIQHRKRVNEDGESERVIPDQMASSVSVVALNDLGENFRTLVDAEMMRRCLAREEPDTPAGSWYSPVRGEDYSDYYVDPITWADVAAELFGDLADEVDG